MKLSSQNKKIIAVAVIFFAIPLSVYFMAIGLKLGSKATVNSVSLSFSQNPVFLNSNTASQINLVLNAGTNKVGFSDIEFTFDQTKVHLASEIITSPTLESPKFLNQGNTAILKTSMQEANQTGKVDIILGLDPSDAVNPPTGIINLAQIAFTSVSGGQSTLAFNTAKLQMTDTTSNELTVNSTDSVVNPPTPTPTQTSSPTASPTAIPTPTSSPVVTSTPVVTPVPTPTITAAPTTVTFKLQGLSKTGRDEIPTITFKQGNTQVYSTNNQIFTSNSLGVYSGSLTFGTAGTYDIYVKVPGYLQKKFANVTMSANIDLTGSPLLAGDFNNDNQITIIDLAKMLSQYTKLSNPVDASNQIYDINNDNNLNIVDIAIVLSNYTQLIIQGD